MQLNAVECKRNCLSHRLGMSPLDFGYVTERLLNYWFKLKVTVLFISFFQYSIC